MAKILILLIAVLVIDALLVLRRPPEVDQIGVARAYREYADNPTKENLRARTERVEAAMRKEQQEGLIVISALFVTTFGGGVAIGCLFERYRQRRRVENANENQTRTPLLPFE